MKQSLRKTPAHLHLAYRYGDTSDNLVGRNFMLHEDGRILTLAIDLGPNFHTRSKSSATYLDAVSLAQNHHRLQFVQCTDNLVRTRLIRAWERVAQPQMRLSLELDTHGRYLYRVEPHSLFMGGIQLDVHEFIGAEAVDGGAADTSQQDTLEHHA
jgi:hypothetical protein